ncbi:4-hydroxythreonine-4-phosphate dehydrogenase PdxA [Pectinatus haikarae]|uniref:4-hydroxythreonine-4-phosphate dehydrogenase PdxA n=1 Tax=Pectinatus haikarae TaxID=349096 RepID=UPI001E44E748|nr:4-hydroxythreonine-4-phosphate dehydrogenase PdxA [Pectinatus haikarae]
MKPIIAITMGDPAGIGPEIVLKTLNNEEIYEEVRPFIIGNVKFLERVSQVVDNKSVFNIISSPEEGKFKFGTVDILNIDNADTEEIPCGVISAKAGAAAYDYIKKSIELGLEKKVDGVATAPIQKEAIHMAGIPYIGHTEMYQGITNSPDALTMFHVDKMRIFFLTRHLSLINACKYVTYDHVLEFIKNSDKAMTQLGMPNARLALAALNPHGGEKGLCGDEEITALQPAVETANKNKVNVFGPIPADSVFRLFELQKCDAVLSLYHDQGHIAAKVHDLTRTVSITVGLPFIRTSVDHGTAFDIAGKGIASAKSMEECVKVTGTYAKSIRRYENNGTGAKK